MAVNKAQTTKNRAYKLKCPYCGNEAQFHDVGAHSFKRPSWACEQFPACDAYVGCHIGSMAPLGGLANQALRTARQSIHTRIDSLWKRPNSQITRKQVYEVIAQCMKRQSFHVGQATEEVVASFESAWPQIRRNLAQISFGQKPTELLDSKFNNEHALLVAAINSTQLYAAASEMNTGEHA